jgi:hypothetical protein
MLGLLNAIQNVGSLVGLPFSPYFSDGIGRRPAVMFGASIMVRPPPITLLPNPRIIDCPYQTLTGHRYHSPNSLPERWNVHCRSFPHRVRSLLRL